MAPQMLNLSVAAEDHEEHSMPPFMAGQFASGSMDMEECDPISDSEFKMLMTLIAIATVASGCIVNGWLI